MEVRGPTQARRGRLRPSQVVLAAVREVKLLVASDVIFVGIDRPEAGLFEMPSLAVKSLSMCPPCFL